MKETFAMTIAWSEGNCGPGIKESADHTAEVSSLPFAHSGFERTSNSGVPKRLIATPSDRVPSADSTTQSFSDMSRTPDFFHWV